MSDDKTPIYTNLLNMTEEMLPPDTPVWAKLTFRLLNQLVHQVSKLDALERRVAELEEYKRKLEAEDSLSIRAGIRGMLMKAITVTLVGMVALASLLYAAYVYVKDGVEQSSNSSGDRK
jgi:hypothetical protein